MTVARRVTTQDFDADGNPTTPKRFAEIPVSHWPFVTRWRTWRANRHLARWRRGA